ncbi:DUF2878 domain-containing protein [Arenimonas caeni]|jgi:hypothetical protein|uniref:DUF2878 domain-containing protein n=1 Tax=Arenimonas caeni TaxID=2058085 RepID=A0A2P6M9K9_9GAMM|nr:DUF2878 domain-containing protein [Arenimonas caeni]MDY0022353.1 DUF2878 domain-containing protein [Arenimonas caeni]PRH82694.1 DUF2878 domain-containing protein [Arenimonas caeni]
MRPSLLAAGNVLGFQAVWLASVAGAGAGLPWAGPLAATLFAALTLRFGGKARADLRLLALALPLGLALDSAFAASGWLVYAEAWPWASLAPVWIWSLWVGFALTLNHSMAFLRQRPVAAVLLGAVGGPLAYWTAAGAFEAVSFGAPVAWVIGALAVGWAAVLPLLFHLDQRLAAGLAGERRAPA